MTRHRVGYGTRQNSTSAPMTVAERRAMLVAGLLYEARVYLLLHRRQCAQARRIADALAALVDATWPVTDAAARGGRR